MRIGIFGGDTAGRTIDDVVEQARRAERTGSRPTRSPRSSRSTRWACLAVVGREVPRIELATGVVPTYSRHPLTMAQQALTVQDASGGRFTLGIGLSHQIVIEGMFGLSFENPLRHMREYLSVLMPLLHDRTCAFAGTTMSTSASVGVPAADVPPPPVLIAAFGPKMLELAGTVADGTVTWMTGPATLASHTVPTITAAAAAAGRPGAGSVRVAADLRHRRSRRVRASARSKEFQVYGFLPSYRAMLDREGAEKPGDVALAGDESTVEKELARLADAGVTEFVASIFGTREERDRTRAFLKDAR